MSEPIPYPAHTGDPKITKQQLDMFRRAAKQSPPSKAFPDKARLQATIKLLQTRLLIQGGNPQ